MQQKRSVLALVLLAWPPALCTGAFGLFSNRGLPSFVLVGLPDAAVKESGQRVEAAIKNSGLQWPRARLTVNLAPANLRKEGPAYDLPIALGVLAASEQRVVDESFLSIPTPVPSSSSADVASLAFGELGEPSSSSASSSLF